MLLAFNSKVDRFLIWRASAKVSPNSPPILGLVSCRLLAIDIAGAVAMTFQSIEADNLGAYLHLKGQALADFIKAQGWTESNGVVAIPVNKDNEAKTTVLTENIKFERTFFFFAGFDYHCD